MNVAMNIPLTDVFNKVVLMDVTSTVPPNIRDIAAKASSTDLPNVAQPRKKITNTVASTPDALSNLQTAIPETNAITR